MDDPGRYRFGSDQIYFKSPDEMAKLFPDIPEALSNTMEIAERCNVELKAPAQLPKPGFPSGFSSEAEYLSHLAHEGLSKKYARVTPGLTERLEFELSVICKMGFEGYFLVVRDFVNAAASLNVLTGCRGSAAGSLVAYSIGITSVDPIKFDLLFERFLNPERVSMPDADIDFEPDHQLRPHEGQDGGARRGAGDGHFGCRSRQARGHGRQGHRRFGRRKR
jgi:DNA polymerase-3 subunit alpha